MEKIMVILSVLPLLPYDFWFALLLLFCGIYFAFIGPALFQFWIIPKIERRYRVSLLLNESDYVALFPNWGIPPFEASFYILCKYMSLEKIIIKNPRPESLIAKFKNINYDINTASKAEIIMSFISLFFFVCMIVSGVVVAIH